MKFAIQKTEIMGPPNEMGCVRIVLSDRQELERSTEWSSIQVSSDTRDMNQLAVIQLRALQRLQTLIGEQISDLEARRTLDRLQP